MDVSLEERAVHSMQKRGEPMDDYKFKLGSEALTEIWTMGYRDLRDLETPFA